MRRLARSWYLALSLTALAGAIALGPVIDGQLGGPPAAKHVSKLVVHLVGRQLWVERPDGMGESVIRAPLGRPTQLTVYSDGGPASLIIPAWAMWIHASPGRPAQTWFEPTELEDAAVYWVGEGAGRLSTVIVCSARGWDPPTYGDPRPERFKTDLEWGAELYASNGCVSCHGEGDTSFGPPLGGGASRTWTLEGGKTIEPTEAFFQASMLEPQRYVPEGYSGVRMPEFFLPPRQREALVAYVMSLE